MSSPRRPGGPPEPGTSTLVTANEDEPQDEGPKTVEVAEGAEDGGATAFLRPPPSRKPAPPKPAAEQSPASTVAMRAEPGTVADDAPGGTAFLRADGPQRRKEPIAPRKG